MLAMTVEELAMAVFLGETEGEIGEAEWAPYHCVGTPISYGTWEQDEIRWPKISSKAMITCMSPFSTSPNTKAPAGYIIR